MREFKVIANRFDSEMGGSAGGAMSIITRSGTNTTAGSVFAFYRADSLRSKGALEKVRREVDLMMRAQSPEAVAGALRGMAQRPDSKDMLARFSGPSLVIVGEQDEVTPVAKAKQMADLLQGSQLVTIPGAGHLTNLEAPEAVNAVVREFLSRNRSA